MVSGLGYVFTDDGGKPRRRLQRLVAALYRAGVSRAGAVFVFNRDDRAEMLRHGILRSDQKVVQVPGSGIDTRRFQAASVPDRAPVFLLIARLLRDTGLFEYVEAARMVRRTRPKARFQIPGPHAPDPHRLSRHKLE